MAATKIRQEQLREVGGLTREIITQVGHTFVPRNALYFDGSVWAKAKADTVANAELLGIVESVKGDTFTIVFAGRITNMPSMTPGAVYYLSWTTAGALTTLVPPETMVNKPVLVARTSSIGYVVNWRGIVGTGGGTVTPTAELYSTTIGDGAATSFVVTPAVDTTKCLVQISDDVTKEVLGGPETITLGWNSGTQVKIDFPVGSPPALDQIRVVIVGIN
jgi:hypothetical protein